MSILLGLARDEKDRARELRRIGLNKLADDADQKAEALYEAAGRVEEELRAEGHPRT